VRQWRQWRRQLRQASQTSLEKPQAEGRA
jgi:hypothetical protein